MADGGSGAQTTCEGALSPRSFSVPPRSIWVLHVLRLEAFVSNGEGCLAVNMAMVK